MYPLKFDKVLKEKIWGGRSFHELLGIELPSQESFGESWEICSHPNGMSIVTNGELIGKNLEALVKKYKEKLVGKEIYEKYGEKFPLLIKYLDVNDRLSVQVHPNDEYALRVEGEFGKSESWYIINASEDAKLIMGLADGITKEIFETKMKNKDFTDIFNIISVKSGDFINVNPGLVHASLKGSVLMCEIQQNSDTTYRIYDFDRLVDGKYRPLHLEKAAEVIEFGQKPEISANDTRENIEVEGAVIQTLIRGDYFNIDKLNINGVYQDNVCSNFKILSILSGTGKIICDSKFYELKKGDTYLIPARLEILIDGNLELLKSFI